MEEIMSKHMANSAQSSNSSESITLNRDTPIQHSAKDAASLGAEALAASNFPLAISQYTKAIATHPQAVDYYIKRSTAYTRTSPSNLASSLADAEVAVVLGHNRGKRESIAQAQLRRGIALFGLGRYADAGKCFEWAKAMSPKEKSLLIWEAKVQDKLSGLESGDSKGEATVKEVPDADTEKAGADAKKAETARASSEKAAAPKPSAPTASTGTLSTPPSKIRHEWYQSTDSVTVTLLAKGVPKDRATVDIQPSSLSISFPLPTGADYDFSLEPLFAPIDPSTSTHKIMSTKVEFILKKATPGQKWHSLENPHALPTTSNSTSADPIAQAILNPKPAHDAPPAYPTSSRSGPKDWDKLAADLTKKPAKKAADDADDDTVDDKEDTYLPDDDEDGGDPANAFFKKIFKGADPDTKRAMMKSYQESNGTALSTNWAEVGKGKVETSPPEGMVARKWGE
ncbi:hypothetical protein MMC11_005019 [Xylographa trunciseda]|nr:hypothetical protein [Xylographa trunciseda]